MAKGIEYISFRKVRRQGKKDGRSWRWKFLPPSWPFWESKDPDPPVDQAEPSQYEANLLSVSHKDMQKMAVEWAQKDEKMLPEYRNAKADKERLEEKIEKEMGEHKDSILSYESAKKAFFGFAPRRIPQLVYWLIFAIVGVGEGFFNFFVFQMFGEEAWKTYMMAGAIILLIPLAAEILGHFLKKEKKTLTDNILITVSFATVASLLVTLALLREAFFEASQLHINMSSDKLAGILIIFNVVIFVIMTVLSYAEARTRPEEYRQAKREYEEALKNIREKGADVEKVTEELTRAEERLVNARTARESTFARYRHLVEAERDIWESYIRTYRHANMSARQGTALPESFKVNPETLIDVPDVFEKPLDWTCPGESDKGGA